MATLWHIDGSAWARRSLPDHYAVLSATSDLPVQSAAALPPERSPAVLRQQERGDSPPVWVLLSAPDSRVWVNGQMLDCGLWVLHDRDEILITGGSHFYFSTEELARVELFPAGERPVFCSRCRQPVQPATPAVRCPACGHWCEQSETKPCWTYGPTCPLCEQPTAFDTGLRWTPEEL